MSKPTSNPSEMVKWSAEQFKAVMSERQTFDRYMWQIPATILGVVALLLNSTRYFSEQMQDKPDIIRLIFIVASVICFYAILMLGRLRVRRKVREEKLRELESLVGNYSIITSSKEITAWAWRHKEIHALINTTTLSIGILLVVGIALLLATRFI